MYEKITCNTVIKTVLVSMLYMKYLQNIIKHVFVQLHNRQNNNTWVTITKLFAHRHISYKTPSPNFVYLDQYCDSPALFFDCSTIGEQVGLYIIR